MSFRRALLMRGADAPSADLVFYDMICTDGSAFIDLGILGNGTLSSDVSFRWSGGTSSSSDSVIIGARNSSGRYFLSALNQYSLAYGVGSYYSFSAKIGDAMKLGYKVTQYTDISSGNSGSYFVVQETGYTSSRLTSANTPTSTNVNLYLFRNNYSVASPCSPYLQITNVIIWSDSTRTSKMLDLRPCTYQGIVGMWDVVSRTFFSNANTEGEFSVLNELVFNDSAIRYAKVSGNGRTYVILNIADTSAFSILVSIASSANIKVGIQFHKQSNMTSALSKSTDINAPSSAAGSPSYDSGWITAGTSKSANQDNYVDGVVGIILSFAYSTNTASCPTIAEIRQYTTIIADNIESY